MAGICKDNNCQEWHDFRPRLEGKFLDRFNGVVQEIVGHASSFDVLEEIALREYRWASGLEGADTVVLNDQRLLSNPEQRMVYRSAILLLRDVIRVGWRVRWQGGVLQLAQPVENTGPEDPESKRQVKEYQRSLLVEARRQKVLESRAFIERMEAPNENGVRIQDLMADPESLAKDLKNVMSVSPELRSDALAKYVDPYLQLVSDGDVCQVTGFRLQDIWRYYRYTWSTPAENTPGRTMLYLVRDRARRHHPIIGIASLENSPIKIDIRDRQIGWHYDSFREDLERRLESLDNVDESKRGEEETRLIDFARSRFCELLALVEDGILEIDTSELASAGQLENPTDEFLNHLTLIAVEARTNKERAVAEWREGETGGPDEERRQERSEMGNISKSAEAELYRRKRAEQLHRLLVARRAFRALLFAGVGATWQKFVRSDEGATAIRAAFMAQKSRHVGTSIMELNVCGAIPPYNVVLGGKLVALCMLSPQVVTDYRNRYGNRQSQIATKLKGEAVVRPAELVYIGTTSLYKVGSSQYNRLRLPSGVVSLRSSEVRWSQFPGHTQGFGTLHIRKSTLDSLEELTETVGKGSRVNHVFGEGPSPKLRILRTGIDAVLQSHDRRLLQLLPRHAMGRLVFGAWLADNGHEFLLGRTREPHYYFGTVDPAEGTKRIIDYWRNRWLISRLNWSGLIDALMSQSLDTLLVGSLLTDGTNREMHISLRPRLRESGSGEGVPVVTVGNAGVAAEQRLRKYLANLYRGNSAYADRSDKALLELVHIPTRLDQAVVRYLEASKDVVFTGNPGDGKTHLMRMLEESISRCAVRPIVEFDASRLSESELYQKWSEARNAGRPFVLAINQAVLFSLWHKYPDFEPLRETVSQVQNAILYGAGGDSLSHTVAVFDLSLRNTLAHAMVEATIDRLTKSDLVKPCAVCPGASDCDFLRNRELLQSTLFRSRLQTLLDHVAQSGYHVTIRELQAFVAFLLLGDRDCGELIKTASNVELALPQLVFLGRGRLFEILCHSQDPSTYTHPIWDERLVSGSVAEWDPLWRNFVSHEKSSIHPYALVDIDARKRAFYFFHEQGEVLMRLSGNVMKDFDSFLHLPERDALRRFVQLVNKFTANDKDNGRLRVWQSHRYNHLPPQVLISAAAVAVRDLELLRPRLSSTMAEGFDLAQDHVLVRHKSNHGISIRVDYDLYRVLWEASQGVPVRVIESASTRRIWKFMDSLAGLNDYDLDDATMIIRDTESKKQVKVRVSASEKRILQVSSEGD